MYKKLNSIVSQKYFPYGVILLLIAPNIAWIFFDKHVWPWDQAWYGEVSVNLYYMLTHSISAWPSTMISAFGTKAPALAWFGQFFVPLSKFGLSIDEALLL